jgi:hypothetical protein
LIKVDFDWDFALNKYSLRAYLQPFPTTSDVGNRIDGASPCKALIPLCNIISKGKLCSNNSKSVLYLPNIYASVARVAEVSYLLFYINKKDLFVCFHIIIKLILFEED